MESWDSWLSRDLHSRSDRRRNEAPLPKGAGGAEEARLWEPGRSETWQGPAAASSSERLLPVAAAGLGAAGSGERQRESHFDPWNSQENALSKHAGCNEESARRQVRGALEQVGR
jgi:hypothetical protein